MQVHWRCTAASHFWGEFQHDERRLAPTKRYIDEPISTSRNHEKSAPGPTSSVETRGNIKSRTLALKARPEHPTVTKHNRPQRVTSVVQALAPVGGTGFDRANYRPAHPTIYSAGTHLCDIGARTMGAGRILSTAVRHVHGMRTAAVLSQAPQRGAAPRGPCLGPRAYCFCFLRLTAGRLWGCVLGSSCPQGVLGC
jgi:hypothetical protein